MPKKLKLKTQDLTQKNIEKIAKIFPGVITEKTDKDGNIKKAIDFDLLKQYLSDNLVEGCEERYTLSWPGKNASILKANTPINKTLRPDKERSVNFDTTKNIYIEGDNFEALKILQAAYQGKVKMIYIDPPYNTGKDFIYKDNFKQKKDEYEEKLDIIDVETGGKLVRNTDSNGRFHSDWLSMMYERLIIARDFLREDGVIFVSIDDHEVHNLRKIMDEIFGEENVEILIWNKNAEGSSGTLKQISRFRVIHEYLVIGYKNKDNVIFNKIKEPLRDKKTHFYTANLEVNKNKIRKGHPNWMKLVSPTGRIWYRQWKFNNEKIKYLLKNNLIYWGKNGDKKPRLIIPIDERRSIFIKSIINKGGTTIGRKDYENILPKNSFSYPKPISLIKLIIELTTSKHNIILDFFAGSGTTADAVMQLNAEDGGNRKFILVQLPEIIDEKKNKTAYDFVKNELGRETPTISDIGMERIRRAGKKIVKDFVEKYTKEIEKIKTNKGKPKLVLSDEDKKKIQELEKKIEHVKNMDIGFRVFKVDSSNMKDVYYHPNKLKQEDLFKLVDNIKEDRTPEDLLTQVILDSGLLLDVDIEEKRLLGFRVFFVNKNALVACFDKHIDIKLIDEIVKTTKEISEGEYPLRIVFRDASFKNDKDLINAEAKLKQLSPSTEFIVI